MKIAKILLFVVLGLAVQKAQAQLQAAFTSDVTSGCQPIRVVFTDTSSGNPTNWKWDLGNGTTAENTSSPSSTYFTPGTYTITLTVINGNDSSTIIKKNYLTVYARPVVDFAASATAGCVPLPIQFTDKTVAGTPGTTTYQWDFGDGNLSQVQNPSHTYLLAGLFKVTLIVKNSAGCTNSASKIDYIRTFDSVVSKFGITAPASCTVPAKYGFTDSSKGPIVSWLWNFGDGGTSTLKNPTHTYLGNGPYTVSLIVTSANGCADTLVKKDAVKPGDINAIFNFPAINCVDRPVVFSNTSQPAALLDSSRWSFGDGKTSNAFSPSNIYTAPGNYNVRLVAWFDKCSDTLNQTITILPQPVASFKGIPTGSCVPPLTVNFTNTTVNGTVVKWLFGNGQSSTLANPVVTYNAYGNYDVTLIVKNPSGCMDTLVKKAYININQPSVANIKGLPLNGCAPVSATLIPQIITPEPVVSYEWDFGDGNSSNLANPSHVYTDTGTYDLKLVIKTVSGCSDTFRTVAKAGTKPKAAFTGGPNFICPETSVSFKNLSSSFGNTWYWTFGDGGNSDLQAPDHLYKDTGWMKVTLITTNNGCADTTAIDNFLYVNPPIVDFKDSFVCADKYTYFFTDNSKGGESWKWYFDKYDSAVGKIANYTFPDTGHFVVTLVVQDSSCVNFAARTLHLIDNKASFTYNDSAVCGVAYKTFIAQGPRLDTSDIVSYQWDFGNGKTIVTDTNSISNTYTQSGTFTVTLVITDRNGCTDTTSQILQVKLYGPVADFTPASIAICAGNTVSFKDVTVSVSPIVSWQWRFGNGVDSLFKSGPFDAVYKTPGVYDVRVTVTDSAGCKSTVTKRKVVSVFKPSASFFTNDTLICAKTPADFTNLSTGAGLRYNWSFGDGKSSTQQNPTNVYNAVGIYDVKLTIRDSLNCVDSLIIPKYVTVAQAKADFSISDSFTTCPPLVVIFKNNSDNNISNRWNFGNGNTSSLESPTHTYTNSGSFQAQLIAFGNGGCSDTATKQITIQGPSGSFNYVPQGGCSPLIVNFTANAKNTSNITWDFSDGESTVTTQNTSVHRYRLPGNYVPKVIFSDDLGCKVPIQGLDTIRVVGATALIASLPTYSYCDSGVVQFYDSTITQDVIERFSWNFGDGTSSSQRNPEHNYIKSGRYTVVFEVETRVGCITRDTIRQPVIVVETPRFGIGADSAVCLPASVQYRAQWYNSDTTLVNWSWIFGNGKTSAKFVPDPVNYTAPGQLSVVLTGANRYGCTNTVSKIMAVNDTPRIVAGPPSYICRGQTVALQASGAKAYRWDNATGLSCLSCQSPQASPITDQIFRAVGTDSNGCKSSDTVLVRVKQPTFLITGRGDTLCAGESFTLKASGKETYLWSPAAGLSAPTSATTATKPGTTTRYQVIASDSLKCFTDTGYIDVVVYPIPQYKINPNQITAVYGVATPVQSTSSADITSWRWSPPSGLSCNTCASPDVTAYTQLTYTVTVSNPGGCTNTEKLTVIPVCDQNNVFIPNTFSPNGDGQNDAFYPRGRGLLLVKSMKIFDRWGELLFDKKDFAVNDPNAGWNGTYHGALLTPDVYVYVIEVVCDGKSIFSFKGNVTLLR